MNTAPVGGPDIGLSEYANRARHNLKWRKWEQYWNAWAKRISWPLMFLGGFPVATAATLPYMAELYVALGLSKALLSALIVASPYIIIAGGILLFVSWGVWLAKLFAQMQQR
jgi:hypothetical protein